MINSAREDEAQLHKVAESVAVRHLHRGLGFTKTGAREHYSPIHQRNTIRKERHTQY